MRGKCDLKHSAPIALLEKPSVCLSNSKHILQNRKSTQISPFWNCYNLDNHRGATPVQKPHIAQNTLL